MRLPSLAAFVLCITGLLYSALSIRAERLPIKIYTSADGLGSSASFNLVRDSRGFIWICSRDGLIRFDGYRFITYRIGDDDAEPAVFDLLPTHDGVYWINLNRGKDYRFVAKDDASLLQPVKQELTGNDPRVPLLNVEAVTDSFPSFEDQAGNLFASSSKGFYLLHDVNGQLQSTLVPLNLPGNPKQGLSNVSFQQGHDGSVWIGTSWGLVRRLPDGRMIHFTLRPKDNKDLVLFVAEAKDGRIWIARPDGLIVLNVEPLSELSGLGDLSERAIRLKNGVVNADGQTQLPQQPNEAFAFTFANILRRDLIQSPHAQTAKPAIGGMLSAADGKLWLATTNGLVLFDGKRFQQFTAEQGLETNNITNIVEDSDGYIWIASFTGLLRMNPKGLTTFDRRDGLAEAKVFSVFENRDGQLHVVTDNFKISRLDNGVFKTGRPQLPADVDWVWHSNVAFVDSHGDWWIITNRKLYRYSGVERIEEIGARRPVATYDDHNGLPSGEPYHVFEDSKGVIWISNRRGDNRPGLTRWQRSTDSMETFSAADGLPEFPGASAFAEDKAGNLWFGFGEGGMARYTDGHFTPFKERDGIPGGMITSLYTDRQGRLWIASAKSGLSRVDDPTASHPVFRQYSIADGLASNNVRCITEDLFGNIYIGTVRGVNRISPETGRISYYGIADGLGADFVTSAFRDHTGVLWFGTYSGLSKLVPTADVPAPAPSTLISSLRIAGVNYSVSPLGQREIAVPEQGANQNDLQIEFFSINGGGNESTRYQYKLDGADKNWSAPSTQRSVNFANLRPGNYRFLVRAINADGVAGANPATLTFRILPPIWQRWWFLTIAFLMLGGVSYAAYRYRLAQLLKVERVRTRIATDLHDDIGASLSRMAILSEVVKAQHSSNGEQSEQMLTNIADSARGLVDSMGDIVWSIDPRRDDLQSVVQRIRQFASDVLEAKGIVWGLRIPPEVEKLKLDPEERQHLFLIFKEGLNNVARHGAGAKSVTLSIDVEGRQLIGEIKDDGCGFTPHEPHESRSKGLGGNGLPNMRERAAQLGGRLEIASAPGAGTRLTFRMKIK